MVENGDDYEMGFGFVSAQAILFVQYFMMLNNNFL